MYEYNATITSVYDGDGSFEAIIELGMGICITRKLRIYGIDTPEMRKEHYDAGKVVRDYVRKLILFEKVVVKTKRDASGKYGRLLADLYIEGLNLGENLIEKRFAKEYSGGAREEWTPEELAYIVEHSKEDS